MASERELGPYGCYCQTMAVKLTGDGCDMCQPYDQRSGEDRRVSERGAWEPRGIARRLWVRRQSDRRKGEG